MKKLFVFSATALVVLALVAALAVAFYIDGIVKKSIEKVGPMVTKTSVTLDAVNLSLLSGGGRIKGSPRLSCNAESAVFPFSVSSEISVASR